VQSEDTIKGDAKEEIEERDRIIGELREELGYFRYIHLPY
jgi:hypothetical protein